ncbi:MAG TPA: trypsin-like serine protease [Candidatus Hydrogenedentes bacterium]|nr:trypsin-like serine protease [Candidatus Hydrogenedentota bacterium]HIJ73773.1 trypsin-like serine protease [Candidatus Hydrogenedentota bacterium]
MRRHVALPILVLSVLVLAARDAAPETVDESRRNAVVRAIEKVSPAVVSVNVIQAQQLRDPFFDDFWGLFHPPRPRYVLREVDSAGSGFFLDKNGHILTNWHVIEGAKVKSVTLPDGRELPVEFLGADERSDIAVLRVTGRDLPYVALGDSSDLMIGEWVIAIGNPFGVFISDPKPSASVGVVSANHRRINPSVGRGERLYQDMIQTDAAINPGNSGGPLATAEGRVVGINTFIFSKSGGNIGLGFAIPINRARRVAEEIIVHGRRRDPWAGFKVRTVASIPEYKLQELSIAARSGCLVLDIRKDCPAYQAGLRPGDVITGINGQPVVQTSDIDLVMWGLFVGEEIVLEIDRQGKTATLRFEARELEW